MAAKSREFSFKELSSRSNLIDYPEDDEDEDTAKAPRRNPFDFGDTNTPALDFSFGADSKFVSNTEVNEFFKASRPIAITDDDEPLGAAWGGAQYSLKAEEPKAQVQSARLRSGSSNQATAQSSPGKVYSWANPTATKPKVLTSASKPTSYATKTVPPPPKPTQHPTKSVPASSVRSNTGSPAAALQTVSASIDDVIKQTPQISVHEYQLLQKEAGQLRRDLQAARQSRMKAPPVAESIKRIIRGEPYSLELYKSLKEKVELLDVAVKMHDGNAIIAVILFLKKTVKSSIFLNEVSKRPKAVAHLSKYLKDHYDFDELARLYRITGNHEEAALLKLNQIMKLEDAKDRLTGLRVCLRDDLQPFPQLADLSSTSQDYATLLEMQIPLEAADVKAEMERRNMSMTTHPRQASVTLCPVITTLYYCCLYHYQDSAAQKSSPMWIKSTFKLSDKQVEWTALTSRAKMHSWKDIDDILTGKGWFGSSRCRSLIGFENVVNVLHRNKAPENVLSKYLRLIDDHSRRISLATKCKCYDVAIETIVAQKDRQSLVQYRQNLPDNAPQHQTIMSYLRNSQIRWKN
ncbi:spermatogenesis-defective protein 39 homolog [Nematostella vectensis]|uniref:spermatogenesis-defective protein 39 homolog n=1 Tax=Nematostella vectensis TaxID=45351 RepID=UPI0020773571|nr:spermatogenesis-defective protein 39 homolog [Nematostella vectensis]